MDLRNEGSPEAPEAPEAPRSSAILLSSSWAFFSSALSYTSDLPARNAMLMADMPRTPLVFFLRHMNTFLYLDPSDHPPHPSLDAALYRAFLRAHTSDSASDLPM